MKILSAYIVTGFLLSCNPSVQNNSEVDFSFTQLSDSISEKVVHYKVVPLETIGEVFLTSTQKIIIHENKIYYLEKRNNRRQMIFIFSTDGKYISKIDRQGRGANEYNSISDYDVNPVNETIAILDAGNRKLFHYNQKAEYLNEMKLNFGAKGFKFLEEKNMLYKVFSVNSSVITDKVGKDIYVYDDNTTLLYSALPFTKPIGMLVGNGIYLLNNGSGIQYLKPYTNEVYSVKSDTVSIKNILKYPFDVIPQEMVEDAFMFGKNVLDKYVYGLHYFETNSLIYSLFMHNKDTYYGFYDKNSGKSRVFKDYKDPTCNCGVAMNIKGTYNDYLIVETDYLKFNNLINFLDPERKKCLNPEIFKMTDELDITSNPVLLLVKFKV